MAINVSCPDCGKAYSLADSVRGRKVRCKECGGVIEVVDAGFAAGPARSVPAKTPARAASPSRRSRDDDDDDDRGGSSGFPMWALGAIGGVAVVALLLTGILIFALRSSDEPQQVAINPDQPPIIVNPPVLNPPVFHPPVIQPNVNPPVVVPPVIPAKDPPVVVPKTKPPVVVPPVGPPADPFGKFPPVGKNPRPKPGDPVIGPIGGFNWTAKADPGPEIKSPAKMTPMPLPPGTQVVFPSTDSDVAALRTGGPGGATTWTAINLNTMKPFGGIQGKINLHSPGVSPDGKYIGGVLDGSNDVHIFSLAESKLAKSFPITEKDRPMYIDFGAEGKIVVATSNFFGTCWVQVFDPASGNEIGRVNMSGHLEARWVAMSPGRKYLVVHQGNNSHGATVIDIATGTEAGKLPPTNSGNCHLAFSADGKEFAIFNDANDNAWIRNYNFDTGELINEITFARAPLSVQGWPFRTDNPRIQFTPDKSAFLLYGELLVSNPGGAMFFKVPRMGNDLPIRRWLGPDHMVQVGGGAMGAVPMQRTAIAALLKKSSANEEARTQLELPPTKAADIASAAAIADSAKETPWKSAVTSNLAGEKARTFSPVKTRFGPDKTIDFQIAGAKSAQAVAITRDTVDPLAGKDLVMADRYDLATGKFLGVVPLFPADGAKSRNPIASLRGNTADGIKLDAEISPDGLTLACRRDAEPNRIDLWNLATAKHLGAFTPHDNDPVDAFALLDGGRLWTTGGGNLTLWQVPEFKALAKGTGWKGKIVVSPNQKTIVVGNGRRLELLDAASGQLLGSFAEHPAAESLIAGYFLPTGREFIAAISNGREHALARWDLAKGVLVASLPVEKLSTENADRGHVIGHASPFHVYFDGNLYAWNFPTSPLLTFPQNVRATNTAPDGFFRVFTKDALLTPTLLTKEAALLTSRLPAAEKLTPPNSKFSVQVNGGEPSYQESAKKAFQAEVERLGHNFADGGFQAFVDASIKQTGTGRYGISAAGPPFGLRPPFMGGPKSKFGGDDFFPGGPGKGPGGPGKGPGGGGNTIEIPLHELTVTLRVVDPAGKEVYKNVSVRTTPDRFTQKTNNPDQELRDMLWQSIGVPSIAPLCRRYRIDGQTFDLPAPANWGF